MQHTETVNPQASQMAELYWMALTRDVPFSQYGENSLTVEAAGNKQIFASLRVEAYPKAENPPPRRGCTYPEFKRVPSSTLQSPTTIVAGHSRRRVTYTCLG